VLRESFWSQVLRPLFSASLLTALPRQDLADSDFQFASASGQAANCASASSFKLQAASIEELRESFWSQVLRPLLSASLLTALPNLRFAASN